LAVLGSFWLFRERLADLLPRLQVKHADWEASFRLYRAEEEAKAIPVQAEAPKATPEEVSHYEQLARLSPRAAILDMRADLESALRLAARRNGITDKGPMMHLIRELRAKGLINSSTSTLLDDLRALGNSAAHDTIITLTESDALRYRELTGTAVRSLLAITLLDDEG
jgi:hypothetical protein